MMNKNKFIKVALIIFSVAIIGVLVWFFYFNYFKKVEPQAISIETVENFASAFDTNDMASATILAKEIIEKNENQVAGYIALASVYLQQGLLLSQQKLYGDLAYDVIQKILALDPSNSDAYRLLALVYETRMEFDKAFEAYDTAYGLDPQDDAILTARGHLYFVMGNNVLAKRDYDKALAINPNNSQALTNLALYYMRNNLTNQFDVEQMLISAIENEANYAYLAEAYNALGVFYLVNELHEDATVSYKSALVYNPDMVPALNGLANAQINLLYGDRENGDINKLQERLGEIVRLTETILNIDPNFSRGYVTKGITLNILQAYEEEKAAYEAGLAVVDNDTTLGMLEKEEVRTTLEGLIAGF